jgi:hypothetical protein
MEENFGVPPVPPIEPVQNKRMHNQPFIKQEEKKKDEDSEKKDDEKPSTPGLGEKIDVKG